MKVYITKYALTQGIYEVEAEDCGNNMIKVPVKSRGFNSFDYYHGEGREWHRTREAAIERAREMRDKKMDSLEKQMKKLTRMRFE